MDNYIIEVRGLCKSYKNGEEDLEVLKGIDFKVDKGKLLCIQGPSGAGKSTLLNLIGALDRPSGGEVLYEGLDIHKLNDRQISRFRNRRMGFIFQLYHLLPEFTALENVLLPALIRSFWRRAEGLSYAKDIFKELGIADRMHFKPNQLSGGEQQRVAIARALINKPDVLLCDEPTGNLDCANGEKILNILKKLTRHYHTTVVLVTHNNDIALFADALIHLKDGRIISGNFKQAN